jgi:acyl-CoA synthetase (AMP-forming)/AMP-acid ligase II
MEPVVLAHTVTTLLRRAYDTYPDRTAMVRTSGIELSYAELGNMVRRLSGSLADLGLQAGDRVVIAVRNSPEFMLVDHALFWSGLVRVAVSFRLHAQEIAEVAADCTAAAVVVDPDTAESVAKALADCGVNPRIVSTSGSGDQLTVDSLIAAGAPIPARVPDPEELAWMPYTSGTTGSPKGVMHTHRSIVACLRNLSAELPPITSDDTLLQLAPMSHLAGWVGLLYTVRGARQLFMADFDATAALTTIEEYRVTTTPVVPTIVNLLTEAAEAGDHDVRSLRTVVYAGSPIAPDKLARAIRAFGEVFLQCYGSTELPMPVASLSQRDHRLAEDGTIPDRLASAGRITPFVDVRIVDSQGVEVAPGETGEIWVRADTVTRGYWQRPEDTAEFFRDGGWGATGDVGKLVDGYLHIVDRKKDMIVSGGFNVFPSEVENIIARYPGVAEVAVVGIPDPRWGETVMAVVVREPGSAVTTEDIQSFCRNGIAGYKLPRHIEFADALPKNPTGKLMRRELRDRYWENSTRLVGG